MPSVEAAKEFFSKFSEDNLEGNIADVTVSRDRTPQERGFLLDLRGQLEKRTKKGEDDLTIKYVNGTPKIVKRSKK